MVRTRCYRDGKLHAEGFPVGEVSEHLRDPDVAVWFDLCAPDASALELIRDELGLHALAVEDALQAGQRPKLDHYPEHLFVVAYAVQVDRDTGVLNAHEVNVFVTSTAMVTVHGAGFDIDALVSRWDAQSNLAGNGVGFLMHGLLDVVVDTQFDAVQALDEEVDALEDRLFDEVTSDAAMQRRSFELRKTLVHLRRLVLPMREVVNALMRRDLDIVDDHLMPYYQDVYDHVLRVSEWTDSLRDLISNIQETRLTVRGNRLNVIMKQVTSWAAIIAVPTAVTGFYGQNVPYPGFAQHWGFWSSTVVMLGLSGFLYFMFRRKDWL
ncbi:MAG: magnesium transporter CorA family protein [Micromonosporaceae bacterium]